MEVDNKIKYYIADVENLPFDNIKFDLVDDLKIWIHTQNDLDCITFDGDIILTSRLDFMNEFGYDAIFENKETKKNVLNKEWDSYNGYVTMLEIFEKYNTDKLIKNYTNTNTFSCNVGVIKFNNQSTKDALISGYHEMKNHYLNNIELYLRLSVFMDLMY